jgi:hypothetical protein
MGTRVRGKAVKSLSYETRFIPLGKKANGRNWLGPPVLLNFW